MCVVINRIDLSRRGLILMELLVALVVTSFLMGSLLQGVWGLHTCVCRWDRSMRMRQSLMAALFKLGGDLRMAGCNPWENRTVEGLEAGADPGHGVQTFTLRMDKRGRDPDSWPDGDVKDPDERIEYRWDTVEGVLRRNNQPVMLGCVENPGGRPFFQLERREGLGWIRIVLNVNEQDDTRSLSSGVCIRNKL